MSRRLTIVMACVLAMGGCGTVTDFGLPSDLVSPANTSSISIVSASLEQRRTAYVRAADALANGGQRFDLPLLALATAGLGAAVFGATDDTARIAGVAGTGLLGARGYYDPPSRYALFVSAARALSCLVSSSRNYAFLTEASTSTWRDLLRESYLPANSGSPLRDDIRRLAPIAISASQRFGDAALRVDDHVLQRSVSPSAPSVSGLMESYRENFEIAQQGEADNVETQGLISQTRFVGSSAGSATFNERASSLLSNAEHNDRLVNLAADLDRCVAMAA